MIYLNMFQHRGKSNSRRGKRVEPAALDPPAPSGACPVCVLGGRCAELETEVMGGAVGGDSGGCSDLLDGLGWNQASLLPAAHFQKHLTIF